MARALKQHSHLKRVILGGGGEKRWWCWIALMTVVDASGFMIREQDWQRWRDCAGNLGDVLPTPTVLAVVK